MINKSAGFCVIGAVSMAGMMADRLSAQAVINFNNAAQIPCTNQLRPIFRTQPLSQVVVWQGSNVTLTANVEGACLYQWRYNGTNLVGSSQDLVLTKVQPEQSGSYQLVAENDSGSVTSSAAGLTVIEPGAAVVDFRNTVLFATTADRRVYIPYSIPLVGTNFGAQLFYGSSAVNLVAVTNPPARFRNIPATDSFAGTWVGGLRVLPGITPGSLVSLQVRWWDADWGETWESVVSNKVFRGMSSTFTYQVPPPGAPREDYYIEGFRSPFFDPCAGTRGGAVILEHPADVTAPIGTTVILSVATTNACIFQWQFNGTNLPALNARFSQLRINSVQPEHAGEYRLIARGTPPVSQPWDTTSQVARVTVVAPRQFASPTWSPKWISVLCAR